MSTIDSQDAAAGPPERGNGWAAWWPLLGPVLGLALVYVARTAGVPELYAKQPHEVAALVLTGLATVIAADHLRRRRDPLSVMLTALSVTILFREIHLEGTGGEIYYLLGAIALWSLAWRDRLLPYLREQPRFKVWLIATAFTYFASQAYARRVFRGFWSAELELHVPAEEVTENVAHFMLLITILLSRPRRPAD